MKTGKKRGAVLITTIVLAVFIAVALGSFLALAVQSAKLSNSSFNFNSALNLAEAGVERAMIAANHQDWTDWSNYDGNPADKTRTVSNVDLGGGLIGEFHVVIFSATWSAYPRVVAEGRTTGSLGSSVRKQLEVRLRRRSLYATGIVAKDEIVFSGGNVEVDSYDSSDPNHSTGGLYDPAKHKDGGTVASVSVVTDIISISNGDVWGYVATGGSDPKAGPNGTILGEDSAVAGYTTVDPNRIATDFTANFDPVEEPDSGFDFGPSSPPLAGITESFTLTGPYGPMSYPDDPSSYTIYKVASIDISSLESLKVDGNVVILVTGDTKVNGEIRIVSDPSNPSQTANLLMFARGDVTVSGNGLVNETGRPENLEIRGSNETLGGQSIKLNGNGAMQAAVYAPNAHIILDGGGTGGEWMGSVVGADIKITGNYKFHYDEALADKNAGNPFTIALWREVTDPAAMTKF